MSHAGAALFTTLSSTTPSGEPPKPTEVDPETGTDPDGTPTENPSG